MIYQKDYTKTPADKPNNFLRPEIDQAETLTPLIQVFEIIKPSFVIIGRNLWRVELIYKPTEKEDGFKKLGEAKLESQTGEEQVWIMPISKPPVSAQSILARGHGWRNQIIITRALPYEGASKIFKAIEQEQTARFLSIGFRQSEYVGRLQISLLQVVEDSRCPLGVICEGGIFRAEFLLQIGSESETIILGTNSRDYFFAGFTIKIIGVSPPRVIDQKLPLSDYKIDLYVFRTGKME